MNNIALNENDVRRSICNESFYEFFLEFWEEINSEPLSENWHLKFLCDELQKVAERVFLRKPKLYDMIINIPPGSTKSTIASQMLPAWIWSKMPEAQFITGSYTQLTALKNAMKQRDLQEAKKYTETFEGLNLRQDQKNKSLFMNNSGGWRLSVGTGSHSVVGWHAHFQIIDDPIDPEGVVSEAELETANRWMSETLPSRKVNQAIVPTILIMQRLHQADPTAKMLEKQEKKEDYSIRHISIPAEVSETNKADVKPRVIIKHYSNGLFDPDRLDRKSLRALKDELSPHSFSGQYQQSPIPVGEEIFNTDMFEIRDHNKGIVDMVRYWDKAGTQDGGAYTVGAKLGKDIEGRWWVLDIVRGRWRSDKREEIILQTAIADGADCPIKLEQEPGSGGKESAESTIRALAGFNVTAERPTGDKIARATPFSIQVNKGNVFLMSGEWNKKFMDELGAFPNSEFKDQVDASAGAFNHLTVNKLVIGAF